MKKNAILLFVLASLLAMTGCPTPGSDPTTPALSSAKAITAFSLAGQSGVITGTNIAITLPYGTDVTALVATFTTTGANVKVGATTQVSGTTANNFTSPVTYIVTAADASTQNYIVTVTVAPGTAKDITSFSIPGETSNSITGTDIAITVPYVTDVTALVPTIAITGVSVSPASGVAHDFTSPATYTVTAGDTSTKIYTVTVTKDAALKDITAFSMTNATSSCVITGTNITVMAPSGTVVTALVPSITITGASVSPNTGVAQDFTSPVTYTVTGADALTKVYTVTVNVLTPVLYANFQTLPVGFTENTEATWASPVALPTVTNTNSYTISLIGKLKVNTTQGPPGGSTYGTIGIYQSGNNTSSIGKITIAAVPGPFMLKVYYAPSSTGDAARKCRVMFDGSEVYYYGDGNLQSAYIFYSGTASVNIEVYGYNGTNGAGLRVFDLWIEK